MLFVDDLYKKRVGKALQEFTLSREVSREFLTSGKNTWAEYLVDGAVTKIYLDGDFKVNDEVNDEVNDRFIHNLTVYTTDIRRRMDAIVERLSELYQTPVTYVVATRHGLKDGRPKLSFRPYISGLRIRYSDIPRLFEGDPELRKLWFRDSQESRDSKETRDSQESRDSKETRGNSKGLLKSFWDSKVYTSKEQLLSCILNKKTQSDKRVLKMASDDGDVREYVAQYVEDHWPLVEIQESKIQESTTQETQESNSREILRSPSIEESRVLDLVKHVRGERINNYGSWIRLGFFLKELEDSERTFETFVEVSRRDVEKFKDVEDCRKLWSKMTIRSSPEGKTTIGTIRAWVREDDPDLYEEWSSRDSRGQDSVGQDVELQLLEALKRIDEIGSKTNVDLIKFEDTQDRKAVRFFADGIEGLIDRSNKNVFLDGIFVASMVSSFPVTKPIGFLSKNIPSRTDVYTCNVVSEAHVNMSSGESNVNIDVFDGRKPYAKVAITGATDQVVKDVSSMKELREIINEARDKAMEQAYGKNVVNYIVNIGQVIVKSDHEDRKDDEELACMALPFCGDLRFSPDAKVSNCNGIFVCDPNTRVWKQQHNVAIEQKLVSIFKSFPVVKNSAHSKISTTTMTPADLRHVLSRRGRADMVHIIAGKSIEDGFAEKLDTNLDLFTVDNGCFDSSSGRPVLRDVRKEDYVKTTTGWSYDRDLARKHRREVEDFLEQVLPVPEERRVVLSYYAQLLSGRRRVKKFLALTDRRAGNNGKSTLLTLFGLFFGNYSTVNTKFVCKGSFDRDRDSHDAGLEPMKGIRILSAEELKENMILDVGFLKRIAGGPGVTVTGRRCGSSETFVFVWQAGVVLVFNEGDCPKFDSGDSAFMNRMIVVPMRSKFVSDAQGLHDEEWTYLMDSTISSKFPEWLSALADILVESYTVDVGVFENLPAEMREWRTGLTTEGNPYGEWLSNNVEVTGDQNDVLLLSTLKNEANGDKAFSRYATAYFRNLQGQGVHVQDRASVKVNGSWSTQRGVVKGVKMAMGLNM